MRPLWDLKTEFPWSLEFGFGASKRQFDRWSNCLLVDPLHGVTRDLARVRQIELVLDVGAVGLDRFRTEMQKLCDLAHVPAFADQFQDLQLAIAELVGQIRFAFASRKTADQFGQI